MGKSAVADKVEQMFEGKAVETLPTVATETTTALVDPSSIVDPFDGCADAGELQSGFLKARIEYMKEMRPEGFKEGLITWSTGQTVISQSETVDFVFMNLRLNRSMMPKYKQGEKGKPICFSPDAIRPTGGTQPQPGPCCTVAPNGKRTWVCKKALWNGNDRPECGEQYHILGLRLSDNQPFVLTCAGTSIKPLKSLRANLIDQAKVISYPGVPARFCVSIEASAIPGTGDWYVWNFVLGERFSKEQAMTYHRLNGELQAAFNAMETEEHESEGHVGTKGDEPLPF